jgi:hypothetical protein
MTTVRTPDGDVPCICAAKGLDGADRECEVITRISVILPRVPGMGVWRLDTGGWFAATTLPATLQLLGSMSTGPFVPAVLRAEQRSKKERMPDGKVQTHRWVQPALDAPGTTIEQLVAASGVASPIPQIQAGERPTPLTAAQVAAQKAEAIKARNEAQTTSQPVDALAGASDGSEAAVTPAAAKASAEPVVQPSATDSADVEEGEVTEQVTEGLGAGELRTWLREHRIDFASAATAARERWGDQVTLDNLTDGQRGQLRDQLAK